MEQLTLESFKNKICDLGPIGSTPEWKFKGTLPAVIDFYAEWCGPCKMVTPILEELSQEYKGRLDIYKINTEQEPELSGLFGISSIPSLLFIPLEDKPQMAVGARPKPELKHLFREALGVEESASVDPGGSSGPVEDSGPVEGL